MSTNKGLGKGLSALFSSTEDDYKKNYGLTEEEVKKGVSEILLKNIYILLICLIINRHVIVWLNIKTKNLFD